MKIPIKARKDMHIAKKRLEHAFQKFVYKYKTVREYRGDKLSEKQQIVYELTKAGRVIQEVSDQTKMTIPNVLSCIMSIKDKGWLIN